MNALNINSSHSPTNFSLPANLTTYTTSLLVSCNPSSTICIPHYKSPTALLDMHHLTCVISSLLSFRHSHSVHSPPGLPHPAHITSSQSPPSLSPSLSLLRSFTPDLRLIKLRAQQEWNSYSITDDASDDVAWWSDWGRVCYAASQLSRYETRHNRVTLTKQLVECWQTGDDTLRKSSCDHGVVSEKTQRTTDITNCTPLYC